MLFVVESTNQPNHNIPKLKSYSSSPEHACDRFRGAINVIEEDFSSIVSPLTSHNYKR